MTQVYRNVQGVDSYQSISSAEYLNMSVYLQLRFALVEHVNSISCRYTIDGDTIAWQYFESSDEALEWIHQKVLDELEKNMKALQNE